jgi:ceramide glucosyltransferase
VLLALFWFFSIPAVLLGLASWKAGGKHLRAVLAGMQEAAPEWTPPATLIVPVKGREPGLFENIRSLLEQDYPDFELLVTVRSSGDPALEEIGPLLGRGARLVVAGPGRPDTSEKIANLLAAVEQARPESRVLVFADSDGRVEPGWLRAIIAPLSRPNVGVVTGFRWYFPERGGLWPLIRSAWNSSVAGKFGAGPAPFAWGGAMALRRETFRAARVPDHWTGSVSDDYQLTRAVRAAGLEIHFTPRAMVASPGECSGREFLAWAVRQMTITRVYHPRIWRLGLLAHVMYCGAMTAGILVIARGHFWAAPVLLLATVPGMLRGAMRRRAAEAMFPKRAAWLRRYGWAYCWLAAPVTWIWLYTFLASLFRTRIEWRGRVYELLAPTRTRVLE